jgi:hypothetical protein
MSIVLNIRRKHSKMKTLVKIIDNRAKEEKGVAVNLFSSLQQPHFIGNYNINWFMHPLTLD